MALGSGVSRGLLMDTQGPDLHGDPLGVVRREDASRTASSSPARSSMAMEILARIPATSYQAFLKMLRTWTVALATALVGRLPPTHADRPCRPVQGLWISGLRRRRQPSRIAPHRVQRRAVFARQGASGGRNRNRGPHSRAAVPPSFQRAWPAPVRSPREKKINSPQMWLTTMFHVGTGLPWDWRTGPSDSSERDHLLANDQRPACRGPWSPPTQGSSDTNTGRR